jgi:hypothetical protein
MLRGAHTSRESRRSAVLNRIASASAARSANSAMRAKKNMAARKIQRVFRGHLARRHQGLQQKLLMARKSLRKTSVHLRPQSSAEKLRQSLVRARGMLRKTSVPVRRNVFANEAAFARSMRSAAQMARVGQKLRSVVRAKKAAANARAKNGQAAATIQRFVRGHMGRKTNTAKAVQRELRNLRLMRRANAQLNALEKARMIQTVLRQASPKNPVRASSPKKNRTPWLKMLGVGGLLALSGKTLPKNTNTHVALRHGSTLRNTYAHKLYPRANISHMKINNTPRAKKATLGNAHRYAMHTLSGGYF